MKIEIAPQELIELLQGLASKGLPTGSAPRPEDRLAPPSGLGYHMPPPPMPPSSPSPPSPPPPVDDAYVTLTLKLNGEDTERTVSKATLESGKRTFDELIRQWMVGWGQEVQPDRGPLMEQHVQSEDVGPALAYVAYTKGLTRAIRAAGVDDNTARQLALHIGQVASIMHPDLADLLEHKNPPKETP